MRPPHRGGSVVGKQTSIFVAISCLASLYVVGRLWSATAEISILAEEVESLAALAREQREVIKTVEQQAVQAQDPLFFSVRKDVPRVISPLDGPLLDHKLVVKYDGSDEPGSEGAPIAIADLDTIERGQAKGWACGRTADVQGPLRIEIYIDRRRVTEVMATEVFEVPTAVKEACHLEGHTGGVAPTQFTVDLPYLRQGTHSLQAFVLLPDGKKFEAYHSPAAFVESTIEPDGVEALRRKDSIILRRNAELVALWEEVRTQIPWRKAEAAAEAMARIEPSMAGEDRLLAVVLAHSEPKDQTIRAIARKTWAPADAAAADELRSNLKVVVKFITCMPMGSLKEPLIEEAKKYGDIIIVEDEDAAQSDARKVLGALGQVTLDPELDADFYAITRDQVIVNLEAMVKMLEPKKSTGNAYLGCIKHGGIVDDTESRWHEPNAARFGERENGVLQYPPHAAKEFYAFSRFVARHMGRSRSVMHTYAFEDTTVGAWMLGLEVTISNDHRFCCDSGRPCSKLLDVGPKCVAYLETACSGVCVPDLRMPQIYTTCVEQKEVS